MKGQMDTENGTIVVDEEVLAKYAGSAAVECFGVVGMASVNMKDDLARLLKKDSIRKGVDVEIVDHRLSIELHIIVAYGVNISTIADNLVSNVKYKVDRYGSW